MLLLAGCNDAKRTEQIIKILIFIHQVAIVCQAQVELRGSVSIGRLFGPKLQFWRELLRLLRLEMLENDVR